MAGEIPPTTRKTQRLETGGLGGAQAPGEAAGPEAARADGAAAPPPAPRAKAQGAETRYTEAKDGTRGKAKGKKKDLAVSKEQFARERFRGTKATTEPGRTSQQVSDRLAAVPESQRGKAAAEMLRSGKLFGSEVAAYVAGQEMKPASLDVALERASSLLASSNDPKLREAVVQGLDSLASPDLSQRGTQTEAQKLAAQRLEGRLAGFFENPRVGAETKLRLAEAVAEQSRNPTLRCAVAVTLNGHLGKMREHLAEDRHNLEASHDPRNLRNIPGGPDDVTEYRLGLQRHIQGLEKDLPRAQETLGKLLFGKDREVPGESERTLGKLTTYLEQHHNGQELRLGKEMMRSLFDPPSKGVMRQFAGMTDELTRSSSTKDAYSLGFFLEAGRQALEVDPRARQEESLALAGKAMQVAVAAGLGYATGAGLLLATLSDPAQDAIGSGIGQLGEEVVGTLIEKLSGLLDKKGHGLAAMQQQLIPRFVHNDAQNDFRVGAVWASNRAGLQR